MWEYCYHNPCRGREAGQGKETGAFSCQRKLQARKVVGSVQLCPLAVLPVSIFFCLTPPQPEVSVQTVMGETGKTACENHTGEHGQPYSRLTIWKNLILLLLLFLLNPATDVPRRLPPPVPLYLESSRWSLAQHSHEQSSLIACLPRLQKCF